MRSEKTNRRQKRIRNIEWDAMRNQLERYKGNFLDVGAGTGYAMYKAESLGFQVGTKCKKSS
jgi:hypothetical protein